ncbi:aminotransferase [Rhodoferax koreense]|uniref:Aminotransferase n=1 Tax=Rhodoferax koreensis TaxID=1842727 RepID=A0A1P8K0Y2_9BURK|nr:aminotransferase class V-fold PLP-dependent enzyme [Rhodoferax koreense]APW39670.1 aminotransferase [Rhodoferax koreense]
MQHPFSETRTLFPILTRKAQLSSCSQSALALPVRAAIQDYLASWQEDGMDWMGWMEAVNDAKSEFAKLIHAHPDEIAVMSSVSDIASSLGSALTFEPAQNGIVVGDIDFPSIGHVWLAHERKGAKVRFVQPDAEHCISLAAYAETIDRHTALVSVSHVSYYNGFLQDIAGVARLAHAHGALVFVDAYQSAGAIDIDVERDQIDVLASGAQKFMLGCPGIAFAYVRRAVAQRLFPSNTGWFGRVNPFAFDIHGLDFAKGAARFNTGTPPMVNAFAARAALKLLNSLDIPTVETYLRHLSGVALEEARRLGLELASPADPHRKGATTAVKVKDAARIERLMAEKGFIVSARNDVIRIAPHFYNTEQEVIGALRTLSGMLAG